jgi:predicted nucleotidyltransferase
VIRGQVLELLKRNQDKIKGFKVQKMSLFGSVARDEETTLSDIDILVKFEVSGTYDMYMDVKFFLEELLGRNVDLITEEALRPEVKHHVEKDLIPVLC